MPMLLVKAHGAMLPKLQAEEALQAAECAAVGGGSLKPEAKRAIVGRWARQAEGAASGGRKRPVTRDALAAMGIGCVVQTSAQGGEP